MNRTVLGAFAMLFLMAAGLFWWQGRAAIDPGKLPPLALAAPQDELSLPMADGKGQRGAALPEATEQTREQKRFDRMDRNRDGKIARVEMLAPRAAAFRKLDADGNNLLSFEEWAVKTGNKFKGADANGDGALDRTEFAATKPRPKKQPACNCTAKAPHAAPATPDNSADD